MDNREAFYQAAAAMPLLTAEQEVRLGHAANQGDDTARRKLIAHNIRLAHKAAAYYAKRNKQVEEEDLIQAGVEGVCEAARRYDPSKGFRFSTYAMQWVNNRIRRHIEETHSRVMRVPQKVAYQYFSGRMSADDRDAYERTHFGSLRLEVRPTGAKPWSDATLKDTIVDEGDTPEQIVIQGSIREHLTRILNGGQLDPEQRTVIIRRYGLDGEPAETCEEMAERLNAEAWMVRAVCDSALEALRELLAS